MKKLMGMHNKEPYTCVYTHICARIDIRVYAKYACIIRVCVVRIYLSCTVGHVHRIPDGRIPKDLLYGELATGSRRTGRPQLQYRDIVKRDMKAVGIDTETWENLAAYRSQWRGAMTKHLKTGEDKLTQATTERRARRKLCVSSVEQPAYTCNKDCHSRISLHSHSRQCFSQAHN